MLNLPTGASMHMYGETYALNTSKGNTADRSKLLELTLVPAPPTCITSVGLHASTAALTSSVMCHLVVTIILLLSGGRLRIKPYPPVEEQKAGIVDSEGTDDIFQPEEVSKITYMLRRGDIWVWKKGVGVGREDKEGFNPELEMA